LPRQYAERRAKKGVARMAISLNCAAFRAGRAIISWGRRRATWSLRPAKPPLDIRCHSVKVYKGSPLDTCSGPRLDGAGGHQPGDPKNAEALIRSTISSVNRAAPKRRNSAPLADCEMTCGLVYQAHYGDSRLSWGQAQQNPGRTFHSAQNSACGRTAPSFASTAWNRHDIHAQIRSATAGEENIPDYGNSRSCR